MQASRTPPRKVVSARGQAGAERAQSVEVVDVGRLGCDSGNGDVWEAGFEVLRRVSLLADALHAFRVHAQDPFGQSVFGEVGQVLGPHQAALDGEVRASVVWTRLS